MLSIVLTVENVKLLFILKALFSVTAAFEYKEMGNSVFFLQLFSVLVVRIFSAAILKAYCMGTSDAIVVRPELPTKQPRTTLKTTKYY